MEEKIKGLLSKSKVEIAPESYYLISLPHQEWKKLLGNPELSPRMSVPFMILSDKYEVTLMLDEIDYTTCRIALRDAKIQGGFRMLTFDIEMDFDLVGFIAFISKILAEEGISIMALSAFSRDHILVSQSDLAKALKVLGPYVGDLC
jgi:hypothetical protein